MGDSEEKAERNMFEKCHCTDCLLFVLNNNALLLYVKYYVSWHNF